MNVFLIKGVLADYSTGCILIKAESILQARDCFKEWLSNTGLDEKDVDEELYYFDESVKSNKYIEMMIDKKDSKPIGVIHAQWGGS
jgi:hypothetical protein